MYHGVTTLSNDQESTTTYFLGAIWPFRHELLRSNSQDHIHTYIKKMCDLLVGLVEC